MPKMAAYSSAKAALTMFSSIVRQELSKWGVKVSVIQPGGFRTGRLNLISIVPFQKNLGGLLGLREHRTLRTASDPLKQ